MHVIFCRVRMWSFYVQRFDFGIQLARSEQRKNQQRPPEFEVDAHNVICRVYPRVAE